MQLGFLGPLGLARPAFGRDQIADPGRADATFGRAKRCILVFLNGGPSQLDTWDMKPGAPANVRGELHPIQSKVPGIHVSELLPRMAAIADRYKIVRSVTHQPSIMGRSPDSGRSRLLDSPGGSITIRMSLRTIVNRGIAPCGETDRASIRETERESVGAVPGGLTESPHEMR
ncbi:MAG: DUF1501 domain-containing protein [Isosphaerales bacterium]